MRSTTPDQLTQRARASGGFTLLEVMIALGILAFGLLGLAAMQLESLRQGSGGWNSTEASAIAWDQLEQIRRMPFTQVLPTAGFVAPAWINDPTFGAGAIPVRVTSPTQGAIVDTVYTVAWRVTNVPGAANLRTVDITVTWTDPDQPAPKTFTLSTQRYNGTG